ncbi:hypothetical protein EB061_13520, partial [bacterium]|nr:hypothetical protein [bacterium]
MSDSYGNGIPGKTVVLSSSPSAGLTIATTPATSDASGKANFTIRSGSTGQRVLSATADGSSITDTETVEFLNPSYFSMAKTSYVIREGESQFTDGSNQVVITRDSSTIAASVALQWQTGTETDRFTAGATVVNFAIGESSKGVPLSSFGLTNNSVKNGDLFFTLRLYSPNNAHELSEQAFAKVWIVDDEVPGDFMLDNTLYSAKDTDGTVSLRVARMGGNTSGSGSVDVVLTSGTAIAGSDFTGTTQTVTFGSGEVEKTVTIPISDVASHRSFYADLRNPTGNWKLRNPSQAKIRILDAAEVNTCDAYNQSVGVNNGFGGGSGTSVSPYLI